MQKLFFLFVMGFALCSVQACGDDEEDTPIQNPEEEETIKPDDGKDEEKPNEKPADTMEAVDLGLPSGTLWATCNVGASSPEEYGGYFAWGETEEKTDYSWETYKWCNGSSTTLTKYCTSSNYGTVDNKTVLELSDDVAHVKWGGDWRMPTEEDIIELILKCSWEIKTINGVKGWLVIGGNGNSIFLTLGNYWTSTLRLKKSWENEEKCVQATYLYLYAKNDGQHHDPLYDPRFRGYKIRPVCD